MGSKTTSRLVFISLTACFVAGIIVILFTQNSYGGGDHFEHYKLAHWGWKYPRLLFSHWGKPVFTILISPFAQFGINGARIFNLLLGLVTAYLIWKLAITLKIKNSLLSLLLVIFTPIYFILMFTSLTEVSFSFFITLATLLFFKEKYLWSAFILSFLPLVRTEGIVLFPLFILAYGLKKQYLALPFLSIGFWLISLLGYSFYDDFWWIITKMPYSGSAKEIYGSGSLHHFVAHYQEILGTVISVLFLFGFFVSLYNWRKKDKYKFKQHFFFLLLIPGSFLTFFAAHSFVWWQGMGNSLGLIRVIGSVAPLASLTALIGFNTIYRWIHGINKYAQWTAMAVLIFFIVRIGINTHKYGFYISKPQTILGKATTYIHDNHLDSHKVYYFNPYAVVKLGLNPYEQSISSWGIPNQSQPSISMPDSSIIIWDAHFGPNEGKTPLERLKNDNGLTLVKSFHPTQPFKVLGGYNYGVYIFQKKTRQVQHDSITNGVIEEYLLDFEKSDNLSTDIVHSGKSSLPILPDQTYVNLLELPIGHLSTDHQPLKIEISAAIYATNSMKHGSPIVVCTLDDNGENMMYQAFKATVNKINSWDTISHRIDIYVIPSNTAQLKLYIWNKNKDTFYLDDVHIKISELDPSH